MLKDFDTDTDNDSFPIAMPRLVGVLQSRTACHAVTLVVLHPCHNTKLSPAIQTETNMILLSASHSTAQVRSVRAAVPDHDSIVCLDNGLYKVCGLCHGPLRCEWVLTGVMDYCGCIQVLTASNSVRCGSLGSIHAMRQTRCCWTMRWPAWGLACRLPWLQSLSSQR